MSHVLVATRARARLRLALRTPRRPRARRFVDGEPRQQRVVLEHDAAIRARPRRLACRGAALAPLSGAISPAMSRHQRGLARAREADDGDELAFLDREVDVARAPASALARRRSYLRRRRCSSRNAHGRSQRRVAVGERGSAAQHDAVEQEADDADGEHRHHDPRERVGAAVLELVPDELAEPGVLRQHLGRDQHHPAHAQRQAQAGEDQRQRRRQHQLEELSSATSSCSTRADVDQVLVDRGDADARC